MPIRVHQGSGLTASSFNSGFVKGTSLTHQELDDNFNSMWPIGSIYINATTDENPRELMGFGEWESFGQRQILVGHNDSPAGFDQNDSPNQIRKLIDTYGSKDTTLSKEIKTISAANGELQISFYSDHNFSKGQRVTIGGIANESGTYPIYGDDAVLVPYQAPTQVVVSGDPSGVFDGTYTFDSVNDVWENGNNSDDSDNKGYFHFKHSENRWQFGATMSYAKGDGTQGAVLPAVGSSGGIDEATGFWTVDSNTNWTHTGASDAIANRADDFTFTNNGVAGVTGFGQTGTASIVANTTTTIAGIEFNLNPNRETEILHLGMTNYSCPHAAITLRYTDAPPPDSIITDPIPGPSGAKTKLPGDGTVTFFGTLYNSSPVGNTIGERMGTGGDFTHTLSEFEIPEHKHRVNWQKASTSTDFSMGAAGYNNVQANTIKPYPPIPQSNGDPIRTAATIYNEQLLDQKGYQSLLTSGKPHNNMMPFITAYFWRRKA